MLEVENKGDNAGDLADLTVIPAVTEGTIMPQYFIAKNVTKVDADTILCTENHASKEEALKCEHTKFVKDTVYGDFMVNFKIDADLNKVNLWEKQIFSLRLHEWLYHRRQVVRKQRQQDDRSHQGC